MTGPRSGGEPRSCRRLDGEHTHPDFVGSNRYSESAPIEFPIFHTGGDGSNAQVIYTLNMIDDDGSGLPDLWEVFSLNAHLTNNVCGWCRTT